MLRLKLGDLIEWEGDEYTVAACTAMATLLYRLADGQRVWVDLAAVTAAGDLSLRPKVGRSGVGGAGPDLWEPLTREESQRALWWEGHLNEVIHGVPDPHDSSLTPRPGYDDPSKLSRRQLKVQELRAAGDVISVRTLARKEAAYAKEGLVGLSDHRVANSRPATVDPRVIEAVLAVLAETATASTVSTVTLINKVRAYVRVKNGDHEVSMPSTSTLRRLIEHYDLRGLARGKATTRRTAANRPSRGPHPGTAAAPGQVTARSTPRRWTCCA